MKQLALTSRVRRGIRRHRRLLAALAAAFAVYAALVAVRETDATTPVLVAAHTIRAGATVGAGDVTLAKWPSGLVPDGAFRDAAAAIGVTTTSTIPARDAVTASDVLEGGSLAAEGFVAMPVRFGSGAPVELLRPGGRIDIIGADPNGTTTVLVDAARVLTTPSGDSGGIFGGDAGAVLVEVTPTQAAKLVGSAGLGGLSFALR